MTRKLLPYEHDLIAHLGVTEEEYLDFLDVQIDYTISNEQRYATPQAFVAPVVAAGAAAATAAATATALAINLAIVSTALTVVGILFQVAAALLAKPPSERNQGARREQRFSPRFGFNSSQELAQYGDPINLVYCNTSQNPNGAVRVGTSLVWSSVESYGSTQFMQLLLVLGAAKIKTLDFERTAFGQLPLKQFSESNVWLYYEDNGNVKFNDKELGDNNDPASDGIPNSENVCQVMFAGNRRNGYSQTFSPSSLTSIGVYDPIPLNVEIMERDSVGKPRWRDLRVTIKTNDYNTNNGARWKEGGTFTVIFNETDTKRDERVAVEAARDMRYQLVESLDRSATYMLGTAKFRLVSVNGGDEVNLDEKDVEAKFECIERGYRPSTPYARTKSILWTEKDLEDIELAIDELEVGASIFATASEESFPTYTIGKSYRATLSDRTKDEVLNITLQSVERWNRDVQLSRPVGTWKGDIEVKLQKYGYKDYNFKGSETLKWEDELDQEKTAILPKGGSIATTEAILQEFLDAKFKLSTKKVRDEIEDDMRRLENLIDSIQSGDIDGEEIRKLAKTAGSAVATTINDLQKEKKKLMSDLDIDKDQLESVKKATSGDVKVLGEKTGLRKNQLQGLLELDSAIDRMQDQRQDLISGSIAVRTAELIRFYRNTRSPFTNRGIDDDNRYGSGGIKAMERRLAQLKGQFTTDQIGVRTVRQYLKGLIEEKKQALKDARKLARNWETLAGAGDDNFFTKCLVKVESAAYQTVTDCDFVNFAIRCKIFRRISGRAKDYGKKEAPEGFKLSDNGVKGRMAFFKVLYKETKAPGYRGLPIIFAVRRNADQDNFIGLAFKGYKQAKWEFKIEPIGDIGAEIQDNGQTQMAFIENAGPVKKYDHAGSSFAWTGSLVPINKEKALKERGPIYTNEWDLFSNRSDSQAQFSFDGGPEFRITSVTEQQKGDNDDKYKSMSMMALGIFSGKGVQDLRSITAYVKEGKISYVVNNDGSYSLSSSSTSFAPDIFADTILDRENGIGKYAQPAGIDWLGLAKAKRFCRNNGLGPVVNGKVTSIPLCMDGVISDLTSWRQFWVETAPFSLLEFARVGGKEVLIPAIPVDNTGRANRKVIVNALFTTGNILEGSYKEEFIDYGDSTQDLIATVIYRDTEERDVFPRNASVQVQLKPPSGFTVGAFEGNAIRQTFDLSQFVSQREQAILFGKLLCNQRRHIRRGIEFKTFPTDSPISPGAYVYVDIGLNTWDRMSSGMIMNNGILNSPLSDAIANGSYDVLIYKNTERTISFEGISIVNGAAAALVPYSGYMFVLGAKGNRKRVFRTTEVQMDEEGEVTVKAMEHPCDNSGSELLSKVANFSNSLFTVR
jgi:hypothetical protein